MTRDDATEPLGRVGTKSLSGSDSRGWDVEVSKSVGRWLLLRRQNDAIRPWKHQLLQLLEPPLGQHPPARARPRSRGTPSARKAPPGPICCGPPRDGPCGEQNLFGDCLGAKTSAGTTPLAALEKVDKGQDGRVQPRRNFQRVPRDGSCGAGGWGRDCNSWGLVAAQREIRGNLTAERRCDLSRRPRDMHPFARTVRKHWRGGNCRRWRNNWRFYSCRVICIVGNTGSTWT